MKKQTYKKGFTLIELLVVIAIIGILSTLAVISLGNARTKARDSKRLSDMRSVESALEIYYTDQQAYPVAATTNPCLIATSIENCCLNNISGAEGGWKTAGNCTGGSTLITVPNDPRNTGTWDNYVYLRPDANTYSVEFALEADPDSTGPLVITSSTTTTNCLSSGGMTANTGAAGCP
ncbi:MAG: hypothetical protein UX17_C0042G0007 [Parcubacteria group bacterium GW2011_GWC2_45_7]|nr:MAG: hypothetical protein UX17_C0042G0007 [Parcubacteria group bacterium GW2011_GWC2_45_7]KKU73992.1 MAG: hypothetical protein UX98_C0002G0022 [Parcubacteria group bacterium GW2011_GWA2_47_26]